MMINRMLSYYRLERVSYCSRIKLLPFFLIVGLIRFVDYAMITSRSPVFLLYAILAVYYMQEIRTIYFEDHSVIRFAPVSKRTVVVCMTVKCFGINLLYTLVMMFFLLSNYTWNIVQTTSFIRMSASVLFLFLYFSISWIIGIAIATIDNRILRGASYVIEIILIMLGERMLFLSFETRPGDLLVLIAQSPHFYLYPLILFIVVILTLMLSMRIFTKKWCS